MAANATDLPSLKKAISKSSPGKKLEFCKKFDTCTDFVSLLNLYSQAVAFRISFPKEESFLDTDTDTLKFKSKCIINDKLEIFGEIKNNKKEAKKDAAREVLKQLFNEELGQNVPQPSKAPNVGRIVSDDASLIYRQNSAQHFSDRQNSVQNVTDFVQNLQIQPNCGSGFLTNEESQRLKTCHVQLVESLDLLNMLAHLYSKDIISSEENEKYFHQAKNGLSHQANTEFLQNLPKKGRIKYHSFLQVLLKKQQWLYNELAPSSTVQANQSETLSAHAQQEAGSGPSALATGMLTPQRKFTSPSLNANTSPCQSQAVISPSQSRSFPNFSPSQSLDQTVPKVVSDKPLEISTSQQATTADTIKAQLCKDVEAIKKKIANNDISVINELCQKYNKRVEYQVIGDSSHCLIDGVSIASVTGTQLKEFKTSVASKTVNVIQEYNHIKRFAGHLSSPLSQSLKQDFERGKKPGVKIMEEYTKAANLQMPIYTEVPNPTERQADGIFSFTCSLEGVELGCATAVRGKKEAKHAAAIHSFKRLLEVSGRSQLVLSDSPADVFDDPDAHYFPPASAAGASSAAPTHYIPPAFNSASAQRFNMLTPSGILSSPSLGMEAGAASAPIPLHVSEAIGAQPANLQNVQPNHTHCAANQQHPLGWYENTPIKGLMLIINNEKFERLSNRVGTNKDAERLRKTFHSLGFQVEVKKDRRALEMESDFETFARKQSKKYSAMIVAVLSHGHNGFITGTDGGPVDIEKSLHLFSAQQCLPLQEKPKFFIFQNCRGENHDYGGVVTDSSSPTWSLSDLFKSRVQPDSPGDHIPSMSDLIVAHSTGQGYYSLRDEVTGSWFIQTLCDVFDQYAHNGEEIGMLLRRVNKQMAARAPEATVNSKGLVTQMPEICDRLTKQWKLSSI